MSDPIIYTGLILLFSWLASSFLRRYWDLKASIENNTAPEEHKSLQYLFPILIGIFTFMAVVYLIELIMLFI